MTKENFAEELKNKLPEYMPDRFKDLEFSVNKISKNNGVELTGIHIDDGSGCIPVFYINNAYNDFCRDLNFEEVIRKFAKIIIDTMDNKLDQNSIIKIIRERSNCIIPKLINTERNRELLNTCPHRTFLDLSVVYEIMLGANQFVLIKDEISDYYDMTEDELYRLAIENIREQKYFTSLKEMFAGIIGEDADLEEFPMLIIRTKSKVHGAGIMLCEDVLSEAAERFHSDLFILPSSIHEVIAVPSDAGDDVAGLKEIVNIANQTEVLPEEFLSDSVYFFDRRLKKLSLAK